MEPCILLLSWETDGENIEKRDEDGDSAIIDPDILHDKRMRIKKKGVRIPMWTMALTPPSAGDDAVNIQQWLEIHSRIIPKHKYYL